MASELFKVSKNDYESNATNTFQMLWNNQNFSDVTLATVDDLQIRAHQVILSSSSLLFQNIFLKNPHQNPLIYLQDVKHRHLEMIIKFIYLGHCNVDEWDKEEFLAAGKHLKVKGLLEHPEFKKEVSVNCITEEQVNIIEPLDMGIGERKRSLSSYNCIECEKVFSTNKQFRYHMKLKHKELKYLCNKCKYKAIKYSYVTTHVRIKHDRIKYECNNCTYTSNWPKSLKMHINTKHESYVERYRYECDKCEYKSKQKTNLTCHIRAKHEGVVYYCDKCEFKCMHKGSLTSHIQAVHEGMRYVCTQCVQQFTQKGQLAFHIQSEHEGVRYHCDQCDYKLIKSLL